MAFDVATSSHYVIGSNVTIPAVVTSHDESVKEVLVIDATCSVTRHDDESTDNVIIDDGCTVSLDRVNGSLSLSLPSSDFSRGRYNVHVHVRLSSSSQKSLLHLRITAWLSSFGGKLLGDEVMNV